MGVVLALLGAWAPRAVAEAGAETEPVTVGVRVVAPFVIDDGDGRYSGLTIGLWEHIAAELGIDYRYEVRSLDGLFTGLEDGSLFASAAALTITAEREERVDFSHPFFVSGLGIAVRHRPAGMWQSVTSLLTIEVLWAVLLLLALLIFWGTMVWLFERRRNAKEFGGTAAEGIGSGFWWAAVTMATVGYGDKAPRTIGGRAVALIWMFSAIIVISFVTASLASRLTVTQLESRVRGPQDLPHVAVGGLEGTAALDFLARENVRARPYPSIEEGIAAVVSGELDAFVHDAPILRYLTKTSFQGQARVLPGMFAEQFYGIALPLGSQLRGPLNRLLLEYLVSDEWARAERRYFGDD
jgi:polar amino acid transport system substrate-binding protein